MACLERGAISMVGCGGGTQQWPLLKMVSPRISVPGSHTYSSPKSSVHVVWFHTYLISSLDPRAEQSMSTHFTDETDGHIKGLRQVTPC